MPFPLAAIIVPQGEYTMNTPRKQFPYTDRRSYLWLAIAFVLTLFATGKLSIPVAAWISSIFALRFMRTQKRAIVGYLLLALVTSVTLAISWSGMIPIPPPGNIAFIIVSGLMAGIPFVADRLLAHRLKGLWATLVFPLSSTAFEFLNMGMGSPTGSFGAGAYTQYDNLILLQILSITGIWGLTFLMNWLPSMVNWAWEESFEWPRIWRGAALYCGIMVLVLVYGGTRLTFGKIEPGTVRVASFTTVSIDLAKLMPVLKQDRQTFSLKTREIHNRYLQQTIKEAQAGAKIILWPEGAGVGVEEDELELMDRGRDIAKQQGIYLAIPFFTMYEDENRPPENKLIIFGPSGNPVMEHIKYGGNVFEGSKLGDGILRTVRTPYGTLSGVICWDTDFIRNVAQSGRNGTDILLSPSHDWRDIDPIHGQMTAFRAIENGISLVRHADLGLSIVTDPYGRTLAAMDHFTASDRTMVVQVPTKGVHTIYSIIGDLFGWLSALGFAAIIIYTFIGRRRGLQKDTLTPDRG
jgi:apolipoprotein N-acyltransferase